MNDETSDPAAEATTGADDPQGSMRERRSSGRSGRRRGTTPTIVTISWRDIPAQLTARAGDDQHKVLLHARFQHAIDRAAAVAGLTSTHEYVQEWRSASSPLGSGDVAARLDQVCAELEAAYSRDRLERLVANGGLEPTTPPSDETPGSPDASDTSAGTTVGDSSESDTT